MALRDPGAPLSVAATIEGYVKAFDDNDLDRVMTYFAGDAVYRTFNGVERVGLAAIRLELEPQFGGAYGALRFDEQDRFIDETSRKATTRWICRHDLAYGTASTWSLKIERAIVSRVVGDRFGWEGVDVFHFDAAAKIKALFTYATCPRRPDIRKELGVSLPGMRGVRRRG